MACMTMASNILRRTLTRLYPCSQQILHSKLSFHNPINTQSRNHSQLEHAWTLPIGNETGISIYNSSTKSKVPLVPSTEGNLKWYVCGPTVYDEPHIGHACCYIRFDIIRRILTDMFNLNVVYMMNVTDIDDKLIDKANKTGQTTAQLSKHYESRFLLGMARLNVLPPTIIHRVTDKIPTIVSFIQRLVENNSAYVTTEGNVYFRCKSYPQYGNLSGRSNTPEAGRSSPDDDAVSLGDKLDAEDFALWKTRKSGEPCWGSPWGEGRPGWHIECSAMASAVFGDTIDIHSGGGDLLFPHHENEQAQSNCYHQTQQWVNYWLHSGLLHIKDDPEKMSKSLGNVIDVDALLTKYTANQFRVFCLLSRYNQQLEFNDNSMMKAIRILKQLASLKISAESYIQEDTDERGNIDDLLLMKSLAVTQRVVREALADDFDTPKSMKAIMNLVHVCNIELCKRYPNKGLVKVNSVNAVAAIINYIERTMSLFGVRLSSQTLQRSSELDDSQTLTQVLNSLTSFREKVRSFSLGGVVSGESVEEKARVRAHRKSHSALLNSCDQIRAELSSLAGIQITDTDDQRSSWHMMEKVEDDCETEKNTRHSG